MTLDPAVASVRRAVRRALPVLKNADGTGRVPDHPGPVLVACSGGADSLALLAATIFEVRRTGTTVIGVVVDHALQEGSAEHTTAVVEQMAQLGADQTASIRVAVDPGPGGVEAGAREARYAALSQIADHFGASSILLGHTLDDQAENVLLGLARGSGGRSIAGMRPVFVRDHPTTDTDTDPGAGAHPGPPTSSPRYLRPLLDVSRATTEAACRAEDITWWDDPHNVDPRFLRSRVRHTALPTLERELGPGVAETLARTGQQLRHDMEALDEIAEDHFARTYDDADGFDVRRIEVLHRAVRTRMLRRAALEAGCPPTELFAVHIEALEEQVWNRAHLPRQIQLPGHVTAYRAGDHLRFEGPAVGR